MNKIYGYARISRKEQSIDRQIRNIRAACPVEEVAAQSEMEKTRFHRLREGKHIPTLVQNLQTQVRKDVEYMTGMVVKKRIILNGRGSRTRTCECWIQNPVSYQLGDSPI